MWDSGQVTPNTWGIGKTGWHQLLCSQGQWRKSKIKHVECSTSSNPSRISDYFFYGNTFMQITSSRHIRIKSAMSRQASLQHTSACPPSRPRWFSVSTDRIHTNPGRCVWIRCGCELNVPKNYSQNISKLIPGKLISSDSSVTFKVLFSSSLFLVGKLVEGG